MRYLSLLLYQIYMRLTSIFGNGILILRSGLDHNLRWIIPPIILAALLSLSLILWIESYLSWLLLSQYFKDKNVIYLYYIQVKDNWRRRYCLLIDYQMIFCCYCVLKYSGSNVSVLGSKANQHESNKKRRKSHILGWDVILMLVQRSI